MPLTLSHKTFDLDLAIFCDSLGFHDSHRTLREQKNIICGAYAFLVNLIARLDGDRNRIVLLVPSADTVRDWPVDHDHGITVWDNISAYTGGDNV